MNKILISIIFISILLTTIFVYKSQSPATEPGAEKREQLSIEQLQEIELHYLNAICPKAVERSATEVVATGFVILYGQLVDPPYQFTISKNTLFLNGVQIDPPIMPPWKRSISSVLVTKRDQPISDLTKRIRAVYRELKVQNQQVDVRAGLIQYIADDEKIVQSAEWVSSDKIHLIMATGEEFSMMFRDHLPTTNYSQARNDFPRDLKNRYETILSNGALLVIGYGSVLTVPSNDAVRTLEQIDLGLREYSTEKLRAVLHHDELVREMLFVQDKF